MMVPRVIPVAGSIPGQSQRTFQQPRRGRPRTWVDKIDYACRAAGLPPTIGLPFRWFRRLRHRHELARLDKAQLSDVGLDPEFIRRESVKPFWQD